MATNIEQEPTPISSLPDADDLIGLIVPGLQHDGRTVKVDLGSSFLTVPILDTEFFI